MTTPVDASETLSVIVPLESAHDAPTKEESKPMSTMIAEGWYKCAILDAVLDTTKTGTSFLAVRMTIVVPEEGLRDITWKLYLSKAAAPYAKAALERLGYDGGDVEELSGVQLTGLVCKVDHEDYRGRTYYRIGYVKIDSSRVVARPKNATALKKAFAALESAKDEPAPEPAKRGKPARPAARKGAPACWAAPPPPPANDDGYDDNSPDSSDDTPF